MLFAKSRSSIPLRLPIISPIAGTKTGVLRSCIYMQSCKGTDTMKRLILVSCVLNHLFLLLGHIPNVNYSLCLYLLNDMRKFLIHVGTFRAEWGASPFNTDNHMHLNSWNHNHTILIHKIKSSLSTNLVVRIILYSVCLLWVKLYIRHHY